MSQLIPRDESVLSRYQPISPPVPSLKLTIEDFLDMLVRVGYIPWGTLYFHSILQGRVCRVYPVAGDF